MILTVLTLLILFGLLSYYIIFSRIKISSFNNEEAEFTKPVSVVICAKNEARNIKEFAPFWLNLKYRNYEVVLVNDQSTDNTNEILENLEKEYSHLKVINISENEKKELKGKRQALWKGIEAASYDYLLFTDADCFSHSRLWIQEMTKAFYDENIEIVLGYSPYLSENTFLNKLIQFDTKITALQYFGFAEIGHPYMSVGRNVAYKKSILTKEIFLSSNKTISGDDDLVFQKLGISQNTAYQLSMDSWIYSLPEKTFTHWFKQKSRHTSTGNYYSFKMKLILGSFILLNVLFTGFLIFNMFNNFTLFVIMLSFKMLAYSSLLRIKLDSMNENIIRNCIQIIIELVYWLFYIIFALSPNQSSK